MHIGVTGTRLRPTIYQVRTLKVILGGFPHGPDMWLHHGDCVGADAEAHQIALDLGYSIHIHPPADGKLRAFLDAAVIDDPAPYLVRNRAIVARVDHLLVVPHGPEGDNPRSGTWATYRVALAQGVPVTVVGGRH